MKYYPEEANIAYDKKYFTSGVYDKTAHCSSQDIFRRQVEMITDVIGSIDGKTTLDIGGAVGWFAQRCKDVGATAFCQDVSAWACENSPIKTNMRCGDAGKGLHFVDDFFDVVTSIESLEHIDDAKNCIKEVSRVLKQDGLFYCSIGLSKSPSHIWVGTIDEWEEIIEHTIGLKVDKKLTDKMRNHDYCKLQNWSAIIARKTI